MKRILAALLLSAVSLSAQSQIAAVGSWTELTGFDDFMTLTYSASAGERVLLVFDAGDAPASIVDDNGTTYTQIHSWTNVFSGTSYAYLSDELATAGTQIEVTFSGNQLFLGVALRLTGVASASPVGDVDSSVANNTAPGVTLTTTDPNEGIFAFLETDGDRTITPIEGYSAQLLVEMNGFALHDVDVGSAGNHTIGGTLNVNVPYSIGAVALKSAYGSESSVTAHLSASRTSCTAPCPVFFDATGTSSTDGTVDTFGEIGYSFNFGDATAGTWTHTGDSKNVQRGGPLAAHVYETAGTYTAKVRARDSSGGASNGDNDQAEVIITVAAANTTFSGTSTVCLSRNTDHTSCPSGATQISNASAWPTFASNTRYLLHTGQDFSALGDINIINLTHIQVGKYGSGSNPIVSNAKVEAGNPTSNGHTVWSSRITFMDLTLNGNGGSDSGHTEVMYLRTASTGVMDFGGSAQYYFGTADPTLITDMQWPVLTFVVDSEVTAGRYGITGLGRSLVLMGNEVHDVVDDGPDDAEHPIRLWQSYKGIVAHNYVYGGNTGRHLLKQHSGGTSSWAGDLLSQSCCTNATRYHIVANNIFGDGSEPVDFAVTIGPQGNSSVLYNEGVEDVIFENNEFMQDSMVEIQMGGRRIQERGNTNAVGTFNSDDSYNPNSIPSGWDGPYVSSGNAITTIDPT